MPDIKPTRSTYKGNVVLTIPIDEQGQQVMSFGRKKAKAIVDYYEDIKEFAEGSPR